MLSKALFRDKKYDEAEEILNDISKKRPADPFVWYELAEEASQITLLDCIGLELSTSFNRRFEAAIMQLREASKLATNFFEVSESIRTRMEEIYQTTEALKRMGRLLGINQRNLFQLINVSEDERQSARLRLHYLLRR